MCSSPVLVVTKNNVIMIDIEYIFLWQKEDTFTEFHEDNTSIPWK